MTKAPKPFKITRAGKYITRDGRTVEVGRNTSGRFMESHPWRGNDGYTRRTDGVFLLDDEGSYCHDIIAKAPASKPRPAKGKKAKRRYVVVGAPRCYGYGVETAGPDGFMMTIASHMSRADARMFAAMKEAQRGGA